jgi:hypothetical protein
MASLLGSEDQMFESSYSDQIMKNCKTCGIVKDETEFHRSKSRGTQHSCKQCRKQIDKKYWEKRFQNKEVLAAKYAYMAAKLEQTRRFVFEYLLEHPCVDCGEKDPVILTFDHQRDKQINISNAVQNRYGLEKLKNEIAKCEVRCANCHMRKTAKDFNWYTHRFKNELVTSEKEESY